LEIAFPWKVLAELNRGKTPPRDGDQWRLNFSRVEWKHEIADGKYRKIANTKENNWVWSPQGVVDMHRPETWGYVQFSTAKPGTAEFRADAAGPVKHLLHRVYYAQRRYSEKHGKLASSLDALALPDLNGTTRLETTSGGFEASAEARLPNGKTQRWHIRQDSRLWSD
jgi:hypothetical protein